MLCNKSAGLPVHETLDPQRPHLHGLLEKQLNQKLVLFHRLDVDTTGVIVFGKHASINGAMTDAFRERHIKKTYLAVVDGKWLKEWTSVESYIQQATRRGYWKNSVKGQAKEKAHTNFRLIESNGKKSLIEASPITGRTHQIRLHCLEKQHVILGDRQYGKAHPQGVPLALHARSIEFTHPATAGNLKIEAPLPNYWKSVWLKGLAAQADLGLKF